MQNMITTLWYAVSRTWAQQLLFLLLVPFSRIYSAIMRLRALGYRIGVLRQNRLPVPVLSVGNLVAGGTGKTPVTALIARYLIGTGRTVAILSRGYGGSCGGGAPQLVSNGRELLLTAEQAGDEPYLLAKTIPGLIVAIGASRYAAGCLVLECAQPDICILDDGFQHLALKRDFDMVLLDARHPLGNGHCLPAGPLREPKSALQRASLIGLTRWSQYLSYDGGEDIPTVHIESKLHEFRMLETQELLDRDTLQNSRFFGVAGIGDPEQFFQGLRDTKMQLVGEQGLPDHCYYTEAMLASLHQRAILVGAEYIITTEKDAVKMLEVAGALRHTIVVASLGLHMHDSQILFEQLEAVFG